MIKELTLKNFKAIEEGTFTFNKINVIVGGNNSGKSSLLESLYYALSIPKSISINKTRRNGKVYSIPAAALLYSPSSNPLSLGCGREIKGGKREEGKNEPQQHINIKLEYNSETYNINTAIRPGTNNNIIFDIPYPYEPDDFRNISNMYCMLVPGITGIPKEELFITNANIYRTVARGDANMVLRNIINRLYTNDKLELLERDMQMFFSDFRFYNIESTSETDLYLEIYLKYKGHKLSLESIGTGLLQGIHILSYYHHFQPNVLLFDEPDSHLHPNNQIVLCDILKDLSEKGVQIIMATHSRTILTYLQDNAKILWMHNGTQRNESDSIVSILRELGSLDVGDNLISPSTKTVVLTEDTDKKYITTLLDHYSITNISVISFNGNTNYTVIRYWIDILHDLSKELDKNFNIIIHMDSDYKNDVIKDKINNYYEMNGDTRRDNVRVVFTEYTDMEHIYCIKEHVNFVIGGIEDQQYDGIVSSIKLNRDNIEHELKITNTFLHYRELGSLNRAEMQECIRHAIEGHIVKGKYILKELNRRYHNQNFIKDSEFIRDQNFEAVFREFDLIPQDDGGDDAQVR